MQNNKGWDFLTTFADINDNYIYQASKPWKENKIKTFKMPLKKVIACAVIVMIVGLGLTHQNEVKAAWEKMTSLIGQILGISEDTGEYIKQIQNKIAKNGVTVSLEEVAVDDETAKIVTEYLEKLFLSVKLDGVPEDYTPAEDAKYEDNDEMNYLDEELEKFFVKQKDEIFDDYSEEERKQMYESVMKFFEKLYDIPQEEETEGLEELDTAAADEFQDFETESLDIEDLG